MPGSIHLNRSWTAASVTGNPHLHPPLFPYMWTNTVFSKKDETSPHHAALGSIHLIFYLTFWCISTIFYLFRTAAEAFIVFQIHCWAWRGHSMHILTTVTSGFQCKKSRLLLVFIELVTDFGWCPTHTWGNGVYTTCFSNPKTGAAFLYFPGCGKDIFTAFILRLHIVGYFSKCVVWEVCTPFFVLNQVWDIAADS